MTFDHWQLTRPGGFTSPLSPLELPLTAYGLSIFPTSPHSTAQGSFSQGWRCRTERAMTIARYCHEKDCPEFWTVLNLLDFCNEFYPLATLLGDGRSG
jgi:hypothetical protein